MLTPLRALVLWIVVACPIAVASAQTAASSSDWRVVAVRFDEFFRHPIGSRGLEWSPSLLAADTRQVRLVGYMVKQDQPPKGRFLLAPRPVQMSEDADGVADDLPPGTVTVLLDPTQRERSVVHQAGLIAVTGRLDIGRHEASSGRVTWMRLQLAPDALAALSP